MTDAMFMTDTKSNKWNFFAYQSRVLLLPILFFVGLLFCSGANYHIHSIHISTSGISAQAALENTSYSAAHNLPIGEQYTSMLVFDPTDESSDEDIDDQVCDGVNSEAANVTASTCFANYFSEAKSAKFNRSAVPLFILYHSWKTYIG